MDVRTEAICELLLLPLSCSLTLVMRQYHKVCHWSVRTDQQRVKRYLTSEENVSGFVLEAEGIHAAVVWSTRIVCLDEICICASHSSTETHHTLVTKMHLCTQNLGCVLPKIFQTRQTVDVPVQSACWYAGYPKCGGHRRWQSELNTTRGNHGTLHHQQHCTTAASSDTHHTTLGLGDLKRRTLGLEFLCFAIHMLWSPRFFSELMLCQCTHYDLAEVCVLFFIYIHSIQ